MTISRRFSESKRTPGSYVLENILDLFEKNNAEALRLMRDAVIELVASPTTETMLHGCSAG